jgi:signal peptidase I
MRHLPHILSANKGLLAFLALMVLFRSAIADWNVVPSGSMLPTIRLGDRILVDKMAYDLRLPLTHIAIVRLGDPQRGDIVTVDSKAAKELIVKRLIGLPGDTVEMRDNVLYLNGRQADYANVSVTGVEGDGASPGEYLSEKLQGGMVRASHVVRLSVFAPSPRRSFGPVTVPPGEYLLLGDNRDDSADSRYFGFFRRDELMGRTRRVAYSLDPERHFLPRLDRFGIALDAHAKK